MRLRREAGDYTIKLTTDETSELASGSIAKNITIENFVGACMAIDDDTIVVITSVETTETGATLIANGVSYTYDSDTGEIEEINPG